MTTSNERGVFANDEALERTEAGHRPSKEQHA